LVLVSVGGRHHGQELVKWDRGGPQHRRRSGPIRTIVGVVVGTGLLVALTTGAYSVFRGPTCDQRSQLDVIASADIQPVLEKIANGYEAEHSCVSIEIRIRPPAAVAEDIVNMANRPDVWVPDASVWVDFANLRAQDGDARDFSGEAEENSAEQVSRSALLQPMLEKGASIARSPVILGAAETTVRKLRESARVVRECAWRHVRGEVPGP